MKGIKEIFKKDWTKISRDFTPELKKEWKEKGFGYKECKEWIESGLTINDADYAGWIRDVKEINTSTPYFYILWPNLLNGQLKEEYLVSKLQEEKIKLTVRGEIYGNSSPFQVYFPNAITGHPGIDQLIQSSRTDPSIRVEVLEQILSNSLEWKNIHLGFVPELEKAWKELGFSYEQAKELINFGLKPIEVCFAEWLKIVKAGWFLENGSIEQLREEHSQYLISVNKGIKISVEASKKIENFTPYWNSLIREFEFPLEQKLLLKELVPSKELRKRIEKYSLCPLCKQPNTGRNLYGMKMWCQPCNAQFLKKEFKNWNSSNPEIDKFIQEEQLKAVSPDKILTWIPYEQLEIEKDENNKNKVIGEGGFGKVCLAKWPRGKIKVGWYVEDNSYESGLRELWESDSRVVLKSLKNSRNITVEFLKEIANTKLVDHSFIAQCYGISRDPKTKDYIMVMSYIRGGDLRQFLKNNYAEWGLSDKLLGIYSIITGLKVIHEKKLIHKDLHPGNLLVNIKNSNTFRGMICYITDLGLCRPASEKHNDKIYGVLPYIAPEVLKNQPYTQASDIYSLGIIAYELLVNTYPYPEMNDMVLALKVHQGYRPNINEVKIPPMLKNLIKKCWDADPEKRLTAGEVHETFYSWLYEVIENKENSPFYQQYLEIEKEYSHFSQNTPYQIHPTATLTSKPINTKPTNKLLQKIEENNISQSVDLDIDKLDDYLKKLKSEEQQVQIEQPPE